ncbi:MAG: DUF2807 domain-containing protein [Saprospiraceae bacterium]|nr:DUF2807 domain-containing protein [Saprospiraceae bacterium]
MNKFAISLSLLLLGATTIFAQNKEKKYDSYESDKRELSKFDALDIEVAADIIIRQTDTYSFEANGPESVLERIKTDVKGNTLHITTQSNWKNWNQFEKIKIYIGVPTLTEIDFSGVGKLELKGKWTGSSLKINLDGAHNVYMPNIAFDEFVATFDGTGSLEVSGQAEKAKLTLNGTGNIYANDLVSQNARCTVNGVGRLECYASNELTAEVSGLGSIYYWGDPKNVRSSINGLGKVKPQKGD